MTPKETAPGGEAGGQSQHNNSGRRIPPATPGLPHDLEAEKAVVGALLIGLPPDVVGQVLNTVAAEDFTAQDHRAILRAVSRVFARGAPVDLITVKAELDGEVENIRGGALYLHHLTEIVPMPGAAVHYAERVREVSRRRQALLDLQAARGRILEGEDAAEVLADLPLAADTGTALWSPADLGPVVAGEIVDEGPTMLTRRDGQGLLYPGKLHTIVGEPEAGKGMLALAATAEELGKGCSVLYVDFEDTEATAVARLLALGVPGGVILERFRYVRAEGPPPPDITALLPEGATLAVLDGMTEAMDALGLDLMSNADVAKFLGRVARPLASRGSGVLILDHPAKDPDARGRGGLGAQHKVAGVDAAFMLEIVTPFGRGLSGLSRLKVTKDRPGFIRAASLGRKIAAEIEFISEGEELAVVVIPAAFQGSGDPLGLTPAERRVMDALPDGPPGTTNPEIGDRVVEMGWDAGLHRATIFKALQVLASRGLADGTEGRWWRTPGR